MSNTGLYVAREEILPSEEYILFCSLEHIRSHEDIIAKLPLNVTVRPLTQYDGLLPWLVRKRKKIRDEVDHDENLSRFFASYKPSL